MALFRRKPQRTTIGLGRIHEIATSWRDLEPGTTITFGMDLDEKVAIQLRPGQHYELILAAAPAKPRRPR